jgi:iron complex transport system permease protein
LGRLNDRQALILLAVLLAVVVTLSAGIGSISYGPVAMGRYLGEALGWAPADPADTLDRNVFLTLRLPRVLLAAFTGAALSVSGALMQGLFRNPIVEPGLAGTSAGAALGAALVFVLGGQTALSFTAPMGSLAVPVMAFAGAFAATLIVWRVSSSFGKVNVFTLLLAGIAVNAVCNAGAGFLSYIARDPQARNITFWSLGTFTTADWRGALIVGGVFAVTFALALRYAKLLNALMLGEDEAHYLGLNPRGAFVRILVLNTLMVATATAMTGVIAFIGLVVPHLVRMLRSSDNAFVLPASALLGAALMEAIDTVARVLIAPAELPIGIITAVIGAPVFLWILATRRGLGGTA